MLADACAELEEQAAASTLELLLRPHADRGAACLYGSAPLWPVARGLGRLAALLGRLEDAVTMLQHALTSSAAMAAPIWVAQAQTDLAGVLIRRRAPGDSQRAAALLELAHACAFELGSRRIARETERAPAMASHTPGRQPERCRRQPPCGRPSAP
jgi:hypothetical protein